MLSLTANFKGTTQFLT